MATTHSTKEHGSTSRLHNIWRAMHIRCYDENAKPYPRYGGRGITICRNWLHNYPAFRKWALSNGYKSHLTIDRKNNNLGYSPRNCRWATYEQQAQNRNNNIEITAFNETKCISAWAKDGRCKVTKTQLIRRIRKGLNPETAITTASQIKNPNNNALTLTAFGETKTVIEWSQDERCAVPLSALYWRERQDWTPEDMITRPSRKTGATL